MGGSVKSGRKRTQRKQNQYNAGHSTRRALHYEFGNSPFEGMEQADADELFFQIGKDHDEKFNESFGELRRTLQSVDPVMLLSILSFLSCFATSGRNPSRTLEHAVLQHHIELLQGLVLRSRLEKFDSRQPVPPQIQKFIDLVRQIQQSFSMRRYADIELGTSLEDKHSARVIEMIRTHTQSVRNWGYPQQIHRMVTDLFAPLEHEIETRCGVQVEHLVQICITITSIAEARINEHLRLLRPALQARTLAGLVKHFQKSFPESVPSRDELISYFRNNGIGLKEARVVLFSYSDQFLPKKFIFAVDDFLAAYPKAIVPKVLQGVLEKWSLSFGDLSATEPEYLFMNNPVWTKPFIRLGDQYFIPTVGLTLSFCLEMMEQVICEDPDLRGRYERRRGQFLETRTKELFEAAFPSAEVFQGSLWIDPDSGKSYENDLLVLIDSFIIIVEAKSSKVSPQARRGAKKSLRSSIQTLLIEPSLQSKRFAEYLRGNPGLQCLSTRNGSVNRINTTKEHKLLRLSVTFDRLGPLQASLKDIFQAGLASDVVDLSPAMHLADLEIVFQTLERSSEKLHYLARRAEFESNAKYIADETDLLAVYHDTGLNLREKEFDGTLLIFYGLSRILDPYFMRQWTGGRAGKPKRRYSKWWRKILERIEAQPMRRWSEIGLLLLNLSYEEQVWFEQEFLKCQKLVSSRNWVRGQNNAFFCLAGAPQQPTLVLGVAYKGLSRDERNAWLEEGAVTAMNGKPVSKAVVIGIDVEKTSDPYPYDVLCVVMKSATATNNVLS